jgi:hypothetical protein
MSSFFRWQFWRNRSRYWRAKCRAAEVRYGQLLLQAEAERWRNVAREDTFASASILGARAMWGVAPRTGPAATQRPPSLLDVANQSGLPTMTGPDRMEFETEWLPFALRNGISRQQAENEFLQELTKRKALNDEPMNTM